MKLALGLYWLGVAVAADYNRDIKPLLARKCFGCHGPGLQQSHLRLDRRSDALRGGESGVAAIEVGKSATSLLIRYVSGTDPKLVMPPTGPRLTAAEIALLREWIDAGAEYADVSVSDAPKVDPRLAHWAFQIGRAHV